MELENVTLDLYANLRLSDLQGLQHVFHCLQRVLSFLLAATCKLNNNKKGLSFVIYQKYCA